MAEQDVTGRAGIGQDLTGQGKAGQDRKVTKECVTKGIEKYQIFLKIYDLGNG